MDQKGKRMPQSLAVEEILDFGGQVARTQEGSVKKLCALEKAAKAEV